MNHQSKNNSHHSAGVIPYMLFGALSIILLLVSVVLFQLEVELVGILFLNLGVSILAVVLVEFTWRHYGGDPIIKAIASLRRTVHQLRELDLSGITAIKTRRRQLEQPEHLALWSRLLTTASRVDMMAVTLRTLVSHHREICTAIEFAISSNLCKVRVLTLNPIIVNTSEPDRLTLQRITEQELLSEGAGARNRFISYLKETWTTFAHIQKRFCNDPERKDCLELRWACRLNMYMSIIRIDDRMWVSPYLSSATGGNAPVFEISGTQTELFLVFEKEFDHMWDHAERKEVKLDI